MFALIETEVIPTPFFFIRMKEKLRRVKGFSVFLDTSFGVKIIRARIVFWYDMPEKKRLKRLRSALSAVAVSGVSGVVVPRNFEYDWLLPDYHLKKASNKPFYKKLAAKLTLYAMDAFNISRDTISAVISERLTSDFAYCAERLCKTVRHLGVYCGKETAAFCARLREEYGLPVIEGISPAMRFKPGFVVAFDPIGVDKLGMLHRDTVILALGGIRGNRADVSCKIADGAIFEAPARFGGLINLDSDVNALLYGLFSMGAVKEDEITVSGLTFDGKEIG